MAWFLMIFPRGAALPGDTSPCGLIYSQTQDIVDICLTAQQEKITGLAAVFLQPANSTHRQYEALRAYFVEGLPSAEAARRFGYSAGSFRVLCLQFRQDPHRAFFVPPSKGPSVAPKRDRVRRVG